MYPSKLYSVGHYSQAKVLVTGSRGQDGSYLREFVGLENSLGIINPYSPSINPPAGPGELEMDISEYQRVRELLDAIRPKRIFHLAAWHGPSGQMAYSREDKERMRNTHVIGTRNILRAMVELELDTHLVVAGSSRIYGRPTVDLVVDEETKTNPIDYYGDTKQEAWDSVRDFRQKYAVRASFLVLFNHESPRRPSGYLSTTIASELSNVLAGKRNEVRLRSPKARGDWSDARDVVRAILKTSELPAGDDFVIGSGVVQSVSDLVSTACEKLNIPIPKITATQENSPSESATLIAAPAKAQRAGVWHPGTPIGETIAEMTLNHLITSQDKRA